MDTNPSTNEKAELVKTNQSQTWKQIPRQSRMLRHAGNPNIFSTFLARICVILDINTQIEFETRCSGLIHNMLTNRLQVRYRNQYL